MSKLSFEKLVRIRWTISLLFSVAMLLAYFGFILVIAFKREWLAVKFSGTIPWGIPIGVGMILFAWMLTGLYISWANAKYDKMVAEIKKENVNPKS